MKFSFSRFFKTLQTFPRAANFIKEHRVWHGFWQYSWVSIILLIIGVFISIQFYSSIIDWWRYMYAADVAELGEETRHLVGGILLSRESFIFSSGFKYVIFILMEIVIFHSVGKTIAIISEEEDRKPTFKIFLKAQIRMIKVAFESWIKEIIATIFISIALGFLGFQEFKSVLIFFVSCYFIGFAMVDNYNERLGMTIRESLKFTRKYTGVALAIGLVVYAIMLIPVIGAFVGPLLGGVTATLVMHEILKPDTNDDFEYTEETKSE
jgi:CysZ protein